MGPPGIFATRPREGISRHEPMGVRRKKRSAMDWVPLSFLVLFLSLTGLGYLAVPGTASALTIVHIPVILGGILSGPIPGMILGGLFGLTNWWMFAPHDPMTQVLPRLLCGLVAGLVFMLARRHGDPESQLTMGSLAASLAGSLTNTLGVALMAVSKGQLNPQEVLGVVLFHGGPEAFLAVLVTLPITVTRFR